MSTATEPVRPAVNGELVNRVQQLRLDTQLAGAKAGGGGGAAWLPWVLCALLAGTWATVALRTYRNPPPGAEFAAVGPVAQTGNSQTPPAGSTSSATPTKPVESGSIQLEVKGYLVPARQIAVSPIDVAGRIVELNIIEGELFNKGDVLAKIEDVSYRTMVDETTAGLAAANQQLEAAESRLEELLPSSVRVVEVQELEAQIREAHAAQERSADDLRRYSELGGRVAGKELVQAKTDYISATAREERLKASLQMLKEGPRKEKVAAAEAEVKAAEAQKTAANARLMQAKWKLDNCVIRAPITGTILSKKAELGNLVNPLAFSASSGSVCDIADLSDLEVDLEIPERDISKLKVGQPTRVKADAYPDRVYTGRLDRIMPIANRAKSIVNVRVKVTLPQGEVPGTFLKPEMGAVVSFLPMK
jgi:multidrug resistance efflux pump